MPQESEILRPLFSGIRHRAIRLLRRQHFHKQCDRERGEHVAVGYDAQRFIVRAGLFSMRGLDQELVAFARLKRFYANNKMLLAAFHAQDF
jgi:hypothetical protein